MKRFWIIAFVILGLFIAGAARYGRSASLRARQLLYERSVGDVVSVPVRPPQPDEEQEQAKPLPSSVNLPVPFTSQAPHANWDDVHEETCEEASVYMAYLFAKGENQYKIPADTAEAELQRIIAWEMEIFGYFKDTTAKETALILTEFYGLKDVTVSSDVTIVTIKKALASGKVVVVPAAGQDLGNPNFTPPGPPYHMLVIKGYTSDGRFITNDPGTRKGENYVYSEQTLIDAIHDWVGDKALIRTGPKAMIVVGPK
jgi:hypothetical protein